jgi:hypothetical protein
MQSQVKVLKVTLRSQPFKEADRALLVLLLLVKRQVFQGSPVGYMEGGSTRTA